MSQQELELPKGWVETKLEDIAIHLQSGGTPSTQKPEYYKNGTIPFVKIDDITDSARYLESTKIKITKQGLENSSAWIVPENSILYTMYASYGIPIINKIKVATSQAMIVYRPPKDLISLDFVYYFLKFMKPFVVTRGTTQRNLNAGIVKNLRVLLPPLNEQKRIVSKIEELFSKIDSTKQSLEHTKLQLEQYVQSLLKSALEGKLTEQWRKANKDKIEPIILENFDEENSELPFGWRRCSIGDVIKPSQEKFDPLKEKNKIFIGLEHIERNTGRIIGKGNSKDTRSTKTIFRKGDTLYGKLRPYLNKVCVPNFDGICSTDILVFPKNPNIINKFLEYFFTSIIFVKFANQNMTGVQHPRISFKVMSEFQIALPSIIEQEQIVSQIEQSFSLIENSQNIVNYTLQTLEIMQMSVLKQAFQGKLVPQDPNDEPAEILLEQIKKERDALMIKNKLKRGGGSDLK